MKLIGVLLHLKIYLSKNFQVGSKGAIVFIGLEDYIKYDSGENAISEIINYLNDNVSNLESFSSILNTALNLKKAILIDISKKETKEFHSILTFDFPFKSKKDKKLDLDKSNSEFNTETKKYTIEKRFETILRARADFRRSKLKTYNYQFKTKLK